MLVLLIFGASLLQRLARRLASAVKSRTSRPSDADRPADQGALREAFYDALPFMLVTMYSCSPVRPAPRTP